LASKANQPTLNGATIHSIPLEAPSTLESCLSNAIRTLVNRSRIRPEALDGFARLRRTLLEWVEVNRTSSPFKTHDGSWKHWDWNVFTDETEIRVGLISLYRNRPIPIHDHPGANGLLLVLNGELKINEYELLDSNVTNNLSLSELTLTGKTLLKANEYACITPESGNIHSLGTESEVCTVLDVLLTPYDETQRTWFMPITDQVSVGQQFSAFRVNKSQRTR
jgi:hypothetical protein